MELELFQNRLACVVFTCCLICASQTNSVLQKPPFIIKRADESVVSGIYCSHKMTGHDRILWYKQDEHKALKLLGYLNVNFPNPEDHVKGKISFDGDGRTHSSLSISNLSLSDSGVYFCAASHHSAADSPLVNAKTLLYVQYADPCLIPPLIIIL
uniref:Ig-like domain-containing protein n=1 Tax=Mola mola TaxID=94237 RepID=A0A3Q3WBB9_MOLML